jgi:hypothetical protein
LAISMAAVLACVSPTLINYSFSGMQ